MTIEEVYKKYNVNADDIDRILMTLKNRLRYREEVWYDAELNGDDRYVDTYQLYVNKRFSYEYYALENFYNKNCKKENK